MIDSLNPDIMRDNIRKAKAETSANTDAVDELNTLVGASPVSDGTITKTLVTHENNIADAYDKTQEYAVGDYVLHNGALYVCTTAVTIPGEWDGDKWSSTNIMDIIKNISVSIESLTNVE